ncbi:MAG: hypothetical protein G01um101433_209 [Parcubacteria group bacterium Gr01-1014_33]|nr:MAG: hypothetical protein G01um101433_209 [Parcubacteria group bacterium Gr01-1014_33]
MHRGIATFTLDTGQCPKWLFERMVKLGREMARVLIEEYGADEFIRRISDPVWFQSLGTVLAFDWNASGLTTILTAALKEAIRGEERNFGVFICGGKGKTSRKTPEEIQRWGQWIGLPETGTQNLVYNSKMSAKVDSALVQDGFQLYHHSFFFSRNGAWSVVQQGMNASEGTARRYHWYSQSISDLVCEPHTAISSQSIGENVLNMVAAKSTDTRNRSTELVHSGYAPLMKEIQIIRKHSSRLSQMIAMKNNGGEQLTLLNLEDTEFHSHPVITEDFSKSKYLEKILARVTDEKPENYEKLIAMEGVGAKTVRALALVSEVIFGAKPSYEDPARYSFAHGGKDATPYPVDRKTYDKTIEMLLKAVRRAKISPVEKEKVIKRLAYPKRQYTAIDFYAAL